MRTSQQILTDICTVDAKLDSLHLIDEDALVDVDVTDNAIGADIVSIAGIQYGHVLPVIINMLQLQRTKLEHELHHARLEEVDGK